MQNLRLQLKLVAAVGIPAALLLIIAAMGLFFSNDSGLATGMGIVALLGAIVCALVGFFIVTPTLRAVKTVTDAAEDLSDRRLPAMLNGEESTYGFEQLNVRPTGDPDLDRIAESIEKIHSHSASSFYEQQEKVRKGLSQVVSNLARRNQNLLDRQIELVDEMEETEQNPDRLEQLFSLDHMATRMKRNQESLLVLADSESPRRGSGNEEVEDVIQVAMGEIEDYRRIDIRKVEPIMVEGSAAGDLAHLISELLENACSFSPPEKNVVVTGALNDSGTYVLSIVDHGIGIDEAQLKIANKLLLEPPDLGLNMGRTLGFAVIGKLAERLEVDVTLVRNKQGKGMSAILELPASLFTGIDDSSSAPADPTPEESAPEESAKPSQSEDSRNVEASIADPLAKFRQEADEDQLSKLLGNGDDAADKASKKATKGKFGSNTKQTPAETWIPPTVTSKAPAKLEDAVPSGEDFDDGLKGLLDDSKDSGRATLARRQPGTSKPDAKIRNPIPKETSEKIPERPTKASSRKPEEIRSMLSKYREGIKSQE